MFISAGDDHHITCCGTMNSRSRLLINCCRFHITTIRYKIIFQTVRTLQNALQYSRKIRRSCH